MRRYSRADEDTIRTLGLVQDWTRSGLLTSEQRTRLEADLQVDLRRTNLFLRAVLALFTALIVAASVGLMMNVLDIEHEVAIAAITGVAALASIGLAEYLVLGSRLYRFGVEEALAVMAVVLAAISAWMLTSWLALGIRGLRDMAALLVGAAGGFGLYRHFGFVYAALGAIACVAAMPFPLDLSVAAERLLSALAGALVLKIVRSKRFRYRDDYTGDEWAWLQAAAFAAIYVALNVHLPWDSYRGQAKGLFYWSTYAGIWILPFAGLALGVREKDRALLDVGLGLALATLITNKAYLGWPRHTWDPIVLGVALVAIAVVVRRWLASGPGGARNGVTPKRLLEKDRKLLSVAGTASSVIAPRPGTAPPGSVSPEPAFRGGRSGGGGGGGSF